MSRYAARFCWSLRWSARHPRSLKTAVVMVVGMRLEDEGTTPRTCPGHQGFFIHFRAEHELRSKTYVGSLLGSINWGLREYVEGASALLDRTPREKSVEKEHFKGRKRVEERVDRIS